MLKQQLNKSGNTRQDATSNVGSLDSHPVIQQLTSDVNLLKTEKATVSPMTLHS